MTEARGRLSAIALGALGLFFCCARTGTADEEASAAPLFPPVEVDVEVTLQRLIGEEDTDGDRKITVDDGLAGDARGDERFELISLDEPPQHYEIVGTYALANLLGELTLARDRREKLTVIAPERIYESPERRISRLIRELYWDGLTRRVDGANLGKILEDEKVATGGTPYLYVPSSDRRAVAYFQSVQARRPELSFQVVELPASAEITPEYVRDDLRGKHGLLSLELECASEHACTGVPFVVPGGRFNEMYGWDSYFEALGLLVDGRVDLARAMVDNFVYQITHYGKILNANRSYYLTRSQPPFLTSMALAVYSQLPREEASKRWLRHVLGAAIREHDEVWMGAGHRPAAAGGLSRYYGTGLGQPPEVEPGHFRAIYENYLTEQGWLTALARWLGFRDWSVRRAEELEADYVDGVIRAPELDEFFVHDRCVRESGHDTTYRWDWDGDRCADFVTVDLNSLLYKMELDIARTLERLGEPREASETWYRKAETRKQLVLELLYDGEQGMFFDRDFTKQDAGLHDRYVSATTFYPLWAWHPDDPGSRILDPSEARRLVDTALPLLEMPGGVAASAEASRGPLSESRPARQWDYPMAGLPIRC